MKYKCFSSGLLDSNVYVAWCEKTLVGCIIDCGAPVTEILDFVTREGIKIEYIVLTHGHYDHVAYVLEYRDAFPEAKTVSHVDEGRVLTDSEANVSLYFGVPTVYERAQLEVLEGDVLILGCESLTVMNTPGHTPGSICLYSEGCGLLFSGDTVFANGWGRCDFKYGDEGEMMASLRRIFKLPPDTLILSGHGEVAHVGHR